MAPNIGFAIRQTQSSRKFQSQEQSYQCHLGQVANANDIFPGFYFQDQGNVS